MNPLLLPIKSGVYDLSTMSNERKDAYVEKRLSSLFRALQAEKEFEGHLFNGDSDIKFSLHEVDPYNYDTFHNLIMHKMLKGVPLFVACIQEGGRSHIFDAECFVTSRFRFNKLNNPLTNIEFAKFAIYKSKGWSWGHFKFVCDETSFPGSNEHWAKFIQASSLTMPNFERGNAQYYMAGFYEAKAKTRSLESNPQKCLEKARFWLELSRMNGFKDANLKLVSWLSTADGIPEYQLAKIQKHLKNFIHNSEQKCPDAIVKLYMDVIEANKKRLLKDMESELEFCKSMNGNADETKLR